MKCTLNLCLFFAPFIVTYYIVSLKPVVSSTSYIWFFGCDDVAKTMTRMGRIDTNRDNTKKIVTL